MSKKYCTNCGSHVMRNFVKCPNCGGHTWSDTASPQPTGFGAGPSTGSDIEAPMQPVPRQGFFQSIIYSARNTFSVRGRASRSEYWWFFLFQMTFLIGLVLLVALAADRYDNTALTIFLGFLVVGFYLWISICGLTLTVRRLHDQGRSGWWLAALFLTFVFVGALAGFDPNLEMSMNGLSTLISLGWLVFIGQNGTSGANKYGNEPIYFA